MVVFCTDGFIGNEKEIIDYIGTMRGQSRVFGFGIGSSVNRYLVEGVARAGRGAAEIVRQGEPADEAVARLYKRLDRPVLTDVALRFSGVDVTATKRAADLSSPASARRRRQVPRPRPRVGRGHRQAGDGPIASPRRSRRSRARRRPRHPVGTPPHRDRPPTTEGGAPRIGQIVAWRSSSLITATPVRRRREAARSTRAARRDPRAERAARRGGLQGHLRGGRAANAT